MWPEERVEWLNRSPDKEAALKMLVILKLVEKLGALSSDVRFKESVLLLCGEWMGGATPTERETG